MCKKPLRLPSALFVLGACMGSYAHSSPRSPLRLDIGSQPLDKAIYAWSSQTGYQVLLPLGKDDERATPGVKGTYTAEGALAALLSGSDFSYQFVNARTVAIQRVANAQVEQPANPRLAQAGARDTQSTVAERGDTTGAKSVQEVIVSAQKRDERLVDVPISIVALGADDLDKRRVGGIDDLARAVPGMASWSNGGYLRRIQLRGIGNGSGATSLIGLYLDEASITSDAGTQLDLRTYDIKRIEVLRGPQGTLYGDGSVGGTIRFITQDPVLDKFGATAQAAALSTQGGSFGERFEGSLNVPVVDDVFGLRLAGTYDHTGGWIDQPAAGKKDFNGQNLKDARLKGLWKPSANLTVNAMALVHRNDTSNNKGEDTNGNYTQTFGLTATPEVKDNFDLYNLTVTYDFPAVRLLSTTGYIDQKTVALNFGTRLGNRPPGTLPLQSVLFEPTFTTKRYIATQELRATSLGSGPWQWTLGVFGRHYSFDDNFPAIYVATEGSALPSPFPSHRAGVSNSWAVFGDSSYQLTPRFTVGAGLRYFKDRPEFTDFILNTVQRGEFQATSPRVYAQYKLTDNVNTYASVAKGFRSGGFNRLGQPPFGPEHVLTYELGTKTSFNRVNAEAALFYSDYKDYQISGFLPPPAPQLFIVRNAGSAHIKGVEWALLARPGDQWEFGLSGDYLQTEFYKVNVVSGAYVVGDPVDLIPKYQVTASVQRDFAWSGKNGFLRIDYSRQGRETFRNRGIGPWYYSESNIIKLLNLNLSVDWTNNMTVGLFGQNLLNDRGYTDAAVINEVASRARPRSYGIEASFKF